MEGKIKELLRLIIFFKIDKKIKIDQQKKIDIVHYDSLKLI